MRAANLLPTPYFHVVFTLPDALDPIALANRRVVYDLLLRPVAETLLEVAADPNHLGAQTGVLAVLHTWGQNLQFHPHVHCVLPGGGLSPDGTRWVASPRNFFLPFRVLSRVFRGKFLAGLRAALAKGKLRFAADRFERLLSAAVRTDWVVYTKSHFARPEHVLKYLARYTHRVAISNARLLDFENGMVRFRYKDYARGNRKWVMTLTALEICRRLLGSSTAAEPESSEEPKETRESPSSVTPTRVCPVCGAGRMIMIREFPPMPAGQEVHKGAGVCVGFDSS
jgi:hypothetical protein